MAKFKDRLKELRDQKGFTQIQLCEELGLSKGAIGNYEAGKRTPRLEDLENIADFFNVEIDYLIGRTNSKPEFSLEEQWIMQCYNNADEDTKTAIKTLLKKFDKRNISSKVS